MPIRPVHSESLADACQKVANENHGFIYTDDPDLRKRIKTEYSNHSEVQKTLSPYTSTVSADKIKTFLDGKAANDEGVSRLDDTNGFFYDPSNFSSAGEKNIDLFTSIFEDSAPVVRDRKMEAEIQDWIEIAKDDIPVLLDHYVEDDRDEGSYLIRVSGGGTTVYFPGNKLYEEHAENRLAKIAEELESEAKASHNFDGTVNHHDIEQALGIEAFDKLLRELERRGFILSLRDTDRWLVNTSRCADAFTEEVVENDIAPRIKREFRDAGYAIRASDFENIVRRQLTNELAASDELEQYEVVDTTVESTIQHLDSDGEEVEQIDLADEIDAAIDPDDPPDQYLDRNPPERKDVEYYLWESEFRNEIEQEYDRLEEKRGTKDRRSFAETELSDAISPPADADSGIKYLFELRVLSTFKGGNT